jgi:RNA polymerase primary sigma factor
MQRPSKSARSDWSALDSYLRDVNAQTVPCEEGDVSDRLQAKKPERDRCERLVLANLRLVVRIAREYAGFGLPLADLVAEGNLALIRAAELYDPSFGTKFHNYASVWIRQRIHRAITKQARSVRIPIWRSQRLRKLAKVNDELGVELGHVPSEAELADRLGLSEDDLSDLLADKIEVLSLDAPTNTDDTDAGSWVERLPDETTPSPDSAMDGAVLMDEAIASLHELDQRELEIVAMKHGLHPQGEMSYRQLAPTLGVSHEWVRRIAQYALVKARRALESVRGLPAPVREARANGVRARIRAFANRRQIANAVC